MNLTELRKSVNTMPCSLVRVSVLLLFLIINITKAYSAGGVRGTITSSEKGETLAFASIFIKQLETGTTANETGYYEIALEPGRYDLVFRFLSHETVVRVIEVTDAYINLDVVLKPQAILLSEVVLGATSEDPAYTIMRKAIAKANYHRQQLDSYSARVYIKGAGKLIDYPWLAKSTLKKEGIEKGRVYVSESVSDVKYTRPKKFEEKVISIRSDGKDNNTSPNGYIFGSFYEPEIAETISPLSPKAFSYYKFEYLGTFKDLDYEISRIKVTPRSKGDNVVEGMIYLVEDYWSIHSLDIKTTKLGITVSIKAVYEPIEDKAWLPVSHRFKAQGKVFGFEFEYNYLATVSNYKIKLNPNLQVDKMEVVDEKVDKKHAKEIEKKYEQEAAKIKKTADPTKQLQERLASGQEITRKELKTLVKEYEKEDRKKQKEPEVISEVNFKIDSGAYKKDSTYWESVRPIPLTKEEVKGYQVSDSMAVIEQKKAEGDTLKQSKHKGFQIYDILLGDSYKVSKHSNFKINTPLGGFNTVDGFHINYRLTFGTILQDTNKTRMTISPLVRYAFSRKVFSGILDFTLRNKFYRLKIEGGKYVRQFNQDEPILPIVNTLTTLLLEQNLMKIYEREFIDLNYQRKLSKYVSINTTWSWAQRHELFNTTNYKWVDRKNIEGYSLNAPVNNELANTSFATNQAFIGSFSITARPWLKFRIRNGERHEIGNSSPAFTLEYRKGFNNILGSDVDFDQLELGIRHQFDVGVRGRLDLSFRGGAFLNSNKMYFMDYKHFLGNRTPFTTSDPVGSFRLLDYYAYSTNDKYFAGNIHYHFRRFLVTSIPLVRMAGVRENIFVNYLATPTSKNYTEVGYGIDGILRLFRVEFAAAFPYNQPVQYGFRLGITTTFGIAFSDNN
jgi:hypothetical protein